MDFIWCCIISQSTFSASAAEGNRIILSKTKDAAVQLRVDAGHFDPATKQLNGLLQVNSQAKSPALVAWVKKNSTHAQLATATFDTNADDKDTELSCMMEELREKAKENLKQSGSVSQGELSHFQLTL